MQLSATYQELSSYIQARFGQPVCLSASEEGEKSGGRRCGSVEYGVWRIGCGVVLATRHKA